MQILRLNNYFAREKPSFHTTLHATANNVHPPVMPDDMPISPAKFPQTTIFLAHTLRRDVAGMSRQHPLQNTPKPGCLTHCKEMLQEFVTNQCCQPCVPNNAIPLDRCGDGAEHYKPGIDVESI